MIYNLLATIVSGSPVAFSVPQNSIPGPTMLARINFPHIAYCNIIDKSLYVGTFDGTPFFGKDEEFVVDVSRINSKSTLVPVKLTGDKIVWPNVAVKAPVSLFGIDGAIVAGGFLVPGKTNGGLWFAPKVGGLTTLFRGQGWYYHAVRFYDVNQDGAMDMITCRAQKPMFGGVATGDLTFLEPVNRSKPLGLWKETVIGKGCDTFFIMHDFNNDGKIDILSAEFWGEKLTLIESVDGKFNDATKLKYTTVDNTKGKNSVDINGDGALDILATNHMGDGTGSVFGYELDGKWTRHDLSKGFPVLQSGIGQAAPGGATSFVPYVGYVGKSPIVLSGDGSQMAYLLKPNNATDVNDWSFTTTVLHNCESTVGYISVGDTNGDGIAEIFVPCYDKGYLVVYNY